MLYTFLEQLMGDATPIDKNQEKIMGLTSTSERIINSPLIFNIVIYEQVMVNYLISRGRELYDYSNFPLNYIRCGMSRNQSVYAKMRTYVRTTPDMSWFNNYRDKVNEEINFKLDPTSSRLIGYHFLRETRTLLDIQRAYMLANSLLFPNKWWGYKCYKCSFTHPSYWFEYNHFLDIYPFANHATYMFIINNCIY